LSARCARRRAKAGSGRFQLFGTRTRYDRVVTLSIELDREDDGRWIAEILEIPGVMCYGTTREESIGNTERLTIEVIADRIAHGEMPASSLNLSFVVLDEQMARS
jgi:predicted RNase H-like HicB family nuclease